MIDRTSWISKKITESFVDAVASCVRRGTFTSYVHIFLTLSGTIHYVHEKTHVAHTRYTLMESYLSIGSQANEKKTPMHKKCTK